MKMHWCVAMLLLMVCGAHGNHNGCPAPRATGGFSMSVFSRRNSTGHWISSVDVGNAQRPGRRPRDMALSVGQAVFLCEDSETVQLTATVTTGGALPPQDYQVVNGLGYYKLHPSTSSWEDARAQCEQEGAHLLIVNSDREADVVKELFVRNPKRPHVTYDLFAHVGIHDRYGEKKFITLYGEQLASSGYSKWAAGNPKGRNDTHCGVIARDALYHDTTCGTKSYYFICEFP